MIILNNKVKRLTITVIFFSFEHVTIIDVNNDNFYFKHNMRYDKMKPQ